ncbi:tumor necrosis factor receptor superfamily member 18 [Anolis carolinensis]|uniref:tumor necrosis factor receptor superfamily member 18 n=1 Tax=Anolis carolinensis TaxID=28377 RepID=UPI002F2B799D
MEVKLRPRLFFFTALCLCLEPGANAEVVCCDASRLEMHPIFCGTCSLGKCCKDNRCKQCRPLPKCLEGEELCRSGTIDFRYICRPCPNGTFSDVKNGCCIPWENCKSHGLQTLQAGNRTHNAQCGPGPTPVVGQPGFTVASIFTVLTAAGIFVLLLMTFLLIVCTCTQKTVFRLVDDVESLEQPNPSESHLLEDDAQSCQFPEEEDGGKVVA